MIAIVARFKLARGLRPRPLPRRTAVLIARAVSLSSVTGAKWIFAVMRELTQEKSVWVNV
jgi:hypothetical protein